MDALSCRGWFRQRLLITERYRSQAGCWGVKMPPGHGGRKNVGLYPLPSLRTNHHPHQPLYNKASTSGLAFLLDRLHLENGTDRLSQNISNYHQMLGTHKLEGRRFDSCSCHGIFLFTCSFWPHYGPGVDPASNRNEYQEYFLGSKGSQCIGLTAFMCQLSQNLGASTSWNPKGL